MTEHQESVQTASNTEPGAVVASTGTAASGTTAPTSMSAGEIAAVHDHVDELVRTLCETAGSRQLAVLDEMSSFGVESQRNTGRQLDLVKTRMAALVDSRGGSDHGIGSGLVEMRAALDRINPDTSRAGLIGRAALAVPFLRDRALVRWLRRIALRYETVSKQVTVIETKLRDGRTMLARDNIELRRMYEDIEGQQRSVDRFAYLGELLLERLTGLVAGADDPLTRERMESAVHDVASRVQDLHTMREVHLQYFVAIELTRQNNNRLGQSVERTLSLASNVVTVGLAIQAALVRQRTVREATARTRAFLGDVLTSNAAAIRRQTEEIGDLYTEPVIALEALTRAHADLLAALDMASRLREEGTAAARRNIVELTTLTHELADHVQGLEDDVEGRP